MPIDTLSDEEIGRLAHAALRGSQRPLTTEEIARAVDWAHETHISAALLDGVLHGRIEIIVPEDGGDLVYRAVSSGHRGARAR